MRESVDSPKLARPRAACELLARLGSGSLEQTIADVLSLDAQRLLSLPSEG